MKYRAREPGFIGRRVKSGEVFDFDGDIPWADPVAQPDHPEAKEPDPTAHDHAPRPGKHGKGKKAPEDEGNDAI